MEWLRNNTIRRSFNRKRTPPVQASSQELDQYACYTSFQRHWQQSLDVIERTQPAKTPLQHDDVLVIISHLDQMMQLLVMELKNQTATSCLDFLLSENLLDKVQYWASKSGEYLNALKLEQLKLYEALISNSKRELLVHEPVLRPLLKLLLTCLDCAPVEVDKRLVILLNQLCVTLVQNTDLVDVFFYTPESDGSNSSFIIFSLLVPFVHREGAIGQQARDALLLCMALSKDNNAMAKYIAETSNFCPVLATGLSGLFSLLPRKLPVDTEGWHCFTIEDANDISELSNFLNSLEFCNAVVQMADLGILEQLLDYVYQGFLVPVMGPAIHQQDSLGLSYQNMAVESNLVEETVTATAYFNLFLRSITEPALLQMFLKFLLCQRYDGIRIIDTLITRINSSSRLCLVTMSLFENLLDLNCEDFMLDLVFQYLIPCSHIMLSQQSRIKDYPIGSQSAEKFLSLTPDCMLIQSQKNVPRSHTSLDVHQTRHRRNNSSASETETAFCSLQDFSNSVESGVGCYLEYLIDAKQRISICKTACGSWTHTYNGDNINIKPGDDAANVTHEDNLHFAENNMVSVSSGYESLRGNTPDLTGEKLDNNDLWGYDDGKMEHHENGISDVKNDIPNIGPFLNALFHKLEAMPFNSFYVNLHLTGVVCRLAIYPQPLLKSFLLDASLVFQPSVSSLFQVLGSLKQRIDQYTSRIHQVEDLVQEARKFTLKREEILEVLKYNTLSDQTKRRVSSPDISSMQPKRNLPMFLSAIKKYNSAVTSIKETMLESTPDGSGYRYINNMNIEEGEDAEEFMKTRHVILCSVIMEDWLKELAAISQEHSVIS